MNLEKLQTGQQAVIKNISGNGNVKKRLLLLGFSPGKIVTMIKSAPLKDPLEVSLEHGHLSIRRQEAALILVDVITGESDE